MASWLDRPARFAAQMLASDSAAAAASPPPSPNRRALVASNDPAHVIAHLPAVLERYHSIMDAAEDCRLLSRAIADGIQDERAEEGRLHAKITELRGWRGGDATEALEEVNGKIAIIREKLARSHRRIADIGYEAQRALAQNVVGYLTSCRNAQLSEYSGPEPKLQKSETYAQGIERCRRDLRGIDMKLEQIVAAPIPSSEASRIASEEIDELARAGAPSVVALLQFGGKIGWQESTSWAMGLDPSMAIAPTKQLESLAHDAWRNKDSLKAQIRALIQENADDATALTPAERVERRAEVLRDKLHLERCEEYFIATGDATIARRPNADVRAILAIEGPAGSDNA